MRQRDSPPPSTKPTSTATATATTPSRLRATSVDSCNGGQARGKAKSATPEAKVDPAKNRRSMVLKRAKSGAEEAAVGSPKASTVNRQAVAAEQLLKPRRLAVAADERRKRTEELEEKVVKNEVLIRDLEVEVMRLKAELDESRSLNVELESKNQKLNQDLASAHAKIAALNIREKAVEEHQSPKFKDIQRLIASKLEQSKVKREVILDPSPVRTRSSASSPSPPPPPPARFLVPQVVNGDRRDPACSPMASPPLKPPPPPPPPPGPLARSSPSQKAAPIVQFYQLLQKQDRKRDPPASMNQNRPTVSSVHSSMVGEIQNRSAHLLAIKADIETKGEFINGLIQKVLAAAYTDIGDVLKFVDWLDGELASLADERAVLKHFKWPERKADTMREAAFEYRDLRKLESELASYVDDPSIQCVVALKRMANLLDKSEQSVQRLIRLRNTAMRSYQDFKIPVDWMLDSGMISKIKQASMKLAKAYMKRVTIELESTRNLDRESTREALLLQGVNFAYRIHQFAGGFDSETLCALEEIRQRVPGRLRTSQELLAGVLSS